MSMTPEQYRVSNRIRVLSRYDRPEALAEARRELRTLTAEQYIKRLVDAAPPLTQEQRARLAAILRPTVDAS